jgi:hypothetical protein
MAKQAPIITAGPRRSGELLAGQVYYTDKGRVIINTMTTDYSVSHKPTYVEYYFPRQPTEMLYATESDFRAMLRR